MRRYFLTGCTGFVGEALVAEIMRRPDTESVCLMTRDPKAAYRFYKIDRRIILFAADILDGKFPLGGGFTDVIHGASPPMSGPFQHDISHTIVTGMRHILEWVEEQGIKSFLFLSSGAASPSHPTPYGRAKYTAERSMKFGKVARLYALVGDDTPQQYAVGQFVREAIADGRVTVRGGDNTFRTYLHVEDCARWILSVLDRGEHRIPYDIGGRDVFSIRKVAELVADVFGVPVAHIPASEPSHAYLPDLGAAHVLGCKHTINLRTALERIRAKAGIRNTDVEPAKAA